jgi:nicotinate-nucleotide pyrophosphorylase (carboxylating)
LSIAADGATPPDTGGLATELQHGLAPARWPLVVPPRVLWESLLRQALLEDLGTAGDLTTDAIVPPSASLRARFAARRPGCVAGLEIALGTFSLLQRDGEEPLCVEQRVEEGSQVADGDTLAIVAGSARAILTGERTALNLLGRLCGIATATRRLVAAVAEHHAQIVCTRKTTPGLRALEKYAVRAGGGHNHRFGLDDAVLIKDNHIAAAGGLELAVERVRRRVGHLVKIEVEVDALEQLERALAVGVEVVLLDNFAIADLRRAVALCRGRVLTEASGGITLDSVAEVAATGVDLISVGWLTHSAPALDIGLDVLGD